MDLANSKWWFGLDALSFAKVNSCLHSKDERTVPQPTVWELSYGNTVLDIDSSWLQLHAAPYFWFEVIRFVIRSEFFIRDAMDQMADEMTQRADVRDKGRVNTAEESSPWVRGGKLMWLQSMEKKNHYWVTVYLEISIRVREKFKNSSSWTIFPTIIFYSSEFFLPLSCKHSFNLCRCFLFYDSNVLQIWVCILISNMNWNYHQIHWSE